MSLNRWVFLTGALAMPLLGSRVLPAQSTPLGVASPAFGSDSTAEWSKLPSHVSACILALPSDQLKRTEVYLHATIADSGAPPLVVQAELMAQNVAEAMHTRMGGTLATSMLLDTFDKLRKNGKALIIWPDGYAADSLVVRLVLWPTALTRDGSMRMIRTAHSQFGVFRILEPIEHPALPKPNNPIPEYPYYDDFVEATKSAVARWQFYPAAVGSCHVKQTVQLPVQYKFPGRSE